MKYSSPEPQSSGVETIRGAEAMSFVQRPTPIEPHTVTQLKNIKPGQRLVYYSGNLEADIARSRTEVGTTGAAPRYAAQLELIQQTAQDLKRKGRVRLEESTRSKTKRGKSIFIIEYTAIGLLLPVE